MLLTQSTGAPHTLGQAQEHISQGPLGARITWVQQDPLEYLHAAESKEFDVAVLAHSLWYFASPQLVLETLQALKRHSKRLCVAEWSLVASRPSAQPHVLAALTQAALESNKPIESASNRNVRTVLGPKRLTELALAAGWQLESETCVPCGEGLGSGQWEVDACFSPYFEKDLEQHVSGERERAVVVALRDSCEASLQAVKGGRKGVTPMDVWVSSFV